MSLPKNFEAEFRRVLAEKEGAALLEVLRRQLPSLTFAELHAVLGSSHGKAIASMRVGALVGGETEVAGVSAAKEEKASAVVEEAPRPATVTKAGAKAKKSSAAGKAKAGKKATKATKAKGETPVKAAKSAASKKAGKKAAKKGKRAARPDRAGPKGLAMEVAIVEALRGRAGPLPSREFRAVFKGAATNTLFRAIQRLIDAGKVQRHGKAPNSSYTLVGAAPVVSAAATSTPEGAPVSEGAATTGKKVSKKTAAKGSGVGKGKGKGQKSSGAKEAGAAASPVTSRTTEGRKAYDTAILSTLRAAGDWVKMSDVQKAVGGTEDQVRIGLRRLTEGGSIERTGERQTTRYKLVG